MNHTTGCVTAKQCALGPTQHFHPIYVKELGIDAIHAGHINVVDVNRDRRFKVIGEVVLGNTSNIKNGETR